MEKQKSRWMLAQDYEKCWWENAVSGINFDFYRAYAEDLVKQLEAIISIGKNTRILEIGSGAAGILTYLDSDFRYAIDPLENYFAGVDKIRKQRDKRVHYHQGKAESLPFNDKEFDLIIIDNVLDHCENISSVVSEMRRVSNDEGIIYLRVNIYTFWGKIVRGVVEKLKIDPGHPFTFTKTSIIKQFQNARLKLLKIEDRGFWSTWFSEIKSWKLKELLKALTLSTPNKTLFVLQKNGNQSC